MMLIRVPRGESENLEIELPKKKYCWEFSRTEDTNLSTEIAHLNPNHDKAKSPLNRRIIYPWIQD